MIFICDKYPQIIKEAVHLYAERFPNCVNSSRSIFLNIIKTFQETESKDNKKHKQIKKATDDGNITNILADKVLNAHVST